MLLTTQARQDAATLVSKLDNATPKSLGITEQPTQSQTETPSPHHKLPSLTARLLKDIATGTIRKQKCRLIIRNLSFQAIEDNILQKFRKFGPITEVSIPRVAVSVPVGGARPGPGAKGGKKQQPQRQPQPPSVEKLKPRGFGFVTFLCESDAQRAVNGGCDGMKICNREFAVDFCLNRHAHEWELKRSEHKDGEEVEDPVTQAVPDDDSESGEEVEDEDEDEDEEAGQSGDEGDVVEEDDDEELDGDEEGDDEEEEEDEGMEDGEKKTAPRQEALADVSEGRTVFVRCVPLAPPCSDDSRDLPYDATPADLKASFSRYGRVELALIVKGLCPLLHAPLTWTRQSHRLGKRLRLREILLS
jgi:RNA recognition motif-containing protein